MNLSGINSKAGKLALALVSIALLLFLFSQVDLARVAGVLAAANPWLVAIGLGLTTASLLLKALRWKLLLDEKSGIPFKDIVPIQLSGIAASNFSPGKMLEPLKVLPLKLRGVGYSFALLTVFWERAFDLMVLFAFAFSAFPSFGAEVRLFLTAIFLALAGGMLMAFRNLDVVISFLAGLPFLGFLGRFKAHSFRKRNLALSFGLSFAAWLLDAAAFSCALAAVGLSVDFLRFTSAYFASVLVGVASFLPGGLGSTETALRMLLSPSPAELPVFFAGVILGRAVSLGWASALGLALMPLVKTGKAGKAAR